VSLVYMCEGPFYNSQSLALEKSCKCGGSGHVSRDPAAQMVVGTSFVGDEGSEVVVVTAGTIPHGSATGLSTATPTYHGRFRGVDGGVPRVVSDVVRDKCGGCMLGEMTLQHPADDVDVILLHDPTPLPTSYTPIEVLERWFTVSPTLVNADGDTVRTLSALSMALTHGATLSTSRVQCLGVVCVALHLLHTPHHDLHSDHGQRHGRHSPVCSVGLALPQQPQ